MDVNLLEAYRSGNREAFACIYRQYAQTVHSYLLRRIGARGDVPDIMQEVFIRAFSIDVREKYDGVRAYGPFLRAIARNVAIDWARRRRREVAMEIDVLETAVCQTAGDYVFDVPCGEHTIRIGAVIDYLNTLDPDLKRIYEERFWRGSTQQRAASSLGISRQTLRTREQRLLAGLRRKLEHGQGISAASRVVQNAPCAQLSSD